MTSLRERSILAGAFAATTASVLTFVFMPEARGPAIVALALYAAMTVFRLRRLAR